MDNTATIRKIRVRQLITERYKGVDAKFAAAIGKAPTQVARWFMYDEKHRRNIGEGLAREIEVALKLPKYWLDHVENDTDHIAGANNDSGAPPNLIILDAAQHEAFTKLSESLTPVQMDEIVAELQKAANEALEKMEGYKQSNEVVMRTFGQKKATTISAARAASRLPAPPNDGHSKAKDTKTRKLF